MEHIFLNYLLAFCLLINETAGQFHSYQCFATALNTVYASSVIKLIVW